MRPDVWGFAFGHRHQRAEHSLPGTGVAFDDAAVVANNFGNKRQPKAGARGLGGDKGIEQMRHEIVRYAAAVILDGDFQGQTDARLTSRNG